MVEVWSTNYIRILTPIYHIKFLNITYVVNDSLLKKVSVYLHIKIIFCIFVKRYKNNLKILAYGIFSKNRELTASLFCTR